MESFDCVVVGAGWYGLGAAKQYHDLNPNESLLIIDSQSSLGGTWADERLYPGLKSNNLLGTYEYPDFPMTPDKFEVKEKQYIPGPSINAYLKAYAEHFGLTDLIRLNTKVTVAEHRDAEGGWTLTIANENQQESKISAAHLIIATGLTSEPFMPHFPGEEGFAGKIFHSKFFQQNRDTIETSKEVTVFGGSKFAWDAVYAYAITGVKVHWVIRSSGSGPCWMAPSYVTPLKQWIEKLANTRLLTWFSPCIWSDDSGYQGIRGFLHGSAIGRAIVNGFWGVLGGDVMSLNNYDGHPETAKLKPWLPAMFTASSFSILNYDSNIFDLIKSGKVEIHIGDIAHLSADQVHLLDGTSFPSQAIISNTGWKRIPPMAFLPEGIERELGIPHEFETDAPITDLANQHQLMKRADAEILDRFPRLGNQPIWNKNYVPLTDNKGSNKSAATQTQRLTPWMLHKFMVPPSERFLRTRDTAFAGIVSNFSTTLTAHLQGLWISAYFSGRLAKDPSVAVGDKVAMEKLQYNTMLQNRFCKWRYPTENKAPSFIFDAVPYLDTLQSDLGLNPFLKTKGLLAEVMSPYGAEDYRHINDEWKTTVEAAKQI